MSLMRSGTLSVSYLLLIKFLTICSVAANSNCTVPGCNSDFCVSDNCTKCYAPYFPTSYSCRQCYLQCGYCDDAVCYRCAHSECDYACKIADCPATCSVWQNVICVSCPDGFYNYGSLCYSCLHSGCKCSLGSDCVECLPGRYEISSYCNNTCPTECITCTSINNCSTCVPGKYGPACASDCVTLCEDGYCDKHSGICSSGCRTDQYLDSNQVCRPCFHRCNSCTHYSNCTSCRKNNYWGPVCQYYCTNCYGNCNRNGGCISGCYDRYYRAYDVSRHGYECILCPDHCLTCNSSLECTSCDTGYWGSYCQHNCTSCLTSCEKNKGCTAGCFSGYYQKQISGAIQCEKCPDICLTCTNSSVCSECKAGYYLVDGRSCIACSNNCINGNCIAYNGTCNEGCVSGRTGAQCEQECPAACVHCEQFNPYICTLCSIGNYGIRCEKNCSFHCKQTIKVQVCQESDGECINGCEVGYWGPTCSSECGRGCFEHMCNETTGICLYGCIDNFIGSHCDRKLLCTDAQNTEKAEPVQTDGKNTNNLIIVGLSVVAGIVFLLALVAIAGVVMLFKKGQLVFIRNKGNTTSSESQNQELDYNAYQDLNRTESADGTYSTVQTDYENTL